MDNFILLGKELREKGEAKCPKCQKGIMKPVFPDHRELLDFRCDNCGNILHFDKC